MKRKKLLTLAAIVAVAGLFLFSGCYTQLRTVSKASPTQDYEKQKAEEPYYEPEYGEAPQESQEQQQEAPVYQYNFYGWNPAWFDFYTPPYYSIGLYFGYYDPWFYDPFLWDPWYGWRVTLWRPFGFWGYSSYWYYSSPYAFSSFYYDPYWDWVYSPYGTYVVPKLQKRRNFHYRRGLAANTGGGGYTEPFMTKTPVSSKAVSRIERIRKKPISSATIAPTETRLRKTSSATRLRKTPTVRETHIQKISRTRRTYAPAIRSRGETEPTVRTRKPRVRSSMVDRTPRIHGKSSTPQRVRTRKTYVPTRRKVYRPSSTSGRSYSPSATRSSSRPSFRGSSSSGRSSSSAHRSSSSSRTRKKK